MRNRQIAVSAEGSLWRSPAERLNELQRRWLRPLNVVQRPLAAAAYGVAWASMRILFRLRVHGRHHLPPPPYVLAPTHTSSLDPLALAASLPYRHLRQTHWIARADAVLCNPLRRSISRLARAMPIAGGPATIAAAAAVLEQRESLVWFPEGHRTTSGELQPFKPGLGVLLQHFDVPVVPVLLSGAHEIMPPGSRLPERWQRIECTFAEPVTREQLGGARASAEILMQSLHRHMTDLFEWNAKRDTSDASDVVLKAARAAQPPQPAARSAEATGEKDAP